MGIGDWLKKTFGKQACAFCGNEVGMLKRDKIKNGEFAGQIPADFDIEKHEPKFAPKTNLGWGMDWIEPGLQSVYRNHFNTRTDEFVADFRAGKYKTQRDMTEQRWRWYMEDYLGCILSLDESITSLLDYLDNAGLSENTLDRKSVV